MSDSPPLVNTLRLDSRVKLSYNYTNGDAVIDTLITIIVCPIQQEIFILNEQCYDLVNFNWFISTERARNKQRVESGYDSQLCRLKDPQTSEEFSFDFV